MVVCICLLPNIINLVLPGLSNKRLLEHHSPILNRSSFKSVIASRLSFN